MARRSGRRIPRDRIVTAAQAVRRVGSGDHIFIGSGCAEPQHLVRALVENEDVVEGEILHILTLGAAPYADPRVPGRFRHNALFIGANVREAVDAGLADYTPVFLSEIPALFRSGRIEIDVALITVAPPDRAGYASLGISVDVVKSAIEAADVVLAEVNPAMPRTHGDSFVHVSEIDAFVESDAALLELPRLEPDAVSREIARNVASLIPDGATLQMGIGEMPDALTPFLAGKHDLGIHTEMLSDFIVDLIEGGVVTGRRKNIHKGKVVTSFCMGSRRLYDYVDDNPVFEFLGVDRVNDPFVISRHDDMVAINSATQVDLTGQVCAESVGHQSFSGIGAQADFIRGASRSRGGKPIIAIRSTDENDAVSRIVPALSGGTGIVTSRGDVHYVVTEYGVASLHGRTVRERTLALISIAHPSFRQELLDAAKARRYVMPSQLPMPESGRPYPIEAVSESLLKDGSRVLFRPLRPDDERALRDFFHSHSDETVYLRYGTPMKRLSQKQVQRFVTLDYDQRMALGAFVAPSDARGSDLDRLIGIARYDLDPSTNLAECAFVVHDDFQGQGLGTQLLQKLMRYARLRRIDGFTAQVVARNVRMMRAFARSCSPMTSHLVEGNYELSFRFSQIDKARRQEAREGAALAAGKGRAPDWPTATPSAADDPGRPSG
ncbi:MAG: GNAT family N-acetyltransferase [Deltaproteobacteria bacterium]|nr:GNAT family N-acetyltransferase [Deltaproteobacteria bacterium]